MIKNRAAVFSWIVLWGIAVFPVLGQANPPFDWKTLADHWKAYATDPSDENALKVYQTFPEKGFVPAALADGEAVVGEILKGFGVLERKIIDKNRPALRLGFRMFSIASGTLAMKLNLLLGNALGFDPPMFLEELGLHRDLFPSLEPLLGSFREDDSLDREGRELERKYRINMLESIRDKSQKNLKDECVRILKKIKISK